VIRDGYTVSGSGANHIERQPILVGASSHVEISGYRNVLPQSGHGSLGVIGRTSVADG
jgi:hypothetical protein